MSQSMKITHGILFGYGMSSSGVGSSWSVVGMIMGLSIAVIDCCIAGDGILFEVLNGIFERLDWKLVLNELPLGIIPCGSGNGLAKAIAHACGYVSRL